MVERPHRDGAQKVRNDIEWNHDTSRALRAFADRLRVPQLSRAIKLIAEGMRSSSDLARVLSIAADDTRNRFKIEQQRRRELSSYVAVVVIGFLVYLLVVALLTTAYLEPISAVSTEPTGTDVESPVSISNLPVAAYETLFFHSAIIQGFGSGLLAGKLVDNKALSGLKYSIGLVLLSTAAFLFI
ncbi:type II secretion system F family protein [Halomicroarcula sp. GCM10025710]